MATLFNLLDQAPDFTLPDASGDVFSLSDSIERHDGWHLIIFSRGAWCPVCVQDLKELESQQGYFLIDESGRLLYQQIQTNPFGRPTAIELRKIVQYIKKNLK